MADPAKQGIPNTAANAWPTKVTDGTNTATVKAASTNAAATDTSIVVSLNPNNAPNVGIADSTSQGGILTSGGATTDVCTMTPAAGIYDVQVNTWAAAETNNALCANMQLKFGANAIVNRLPSTSTGGGAVRVRVTGDGATALHVATIAAATASSTYAACIVITRVV